ncbi:hypothetical protein SCHPADRAFT_936174 [Schizopora paradoxa]|uniref:Uncharacterized protein n=1 Tax=Schizopora paradoxa TaxID=27342 RepID=A0A0H2S9Z0_9AGAM|nr:hypothetical protein SCHPADRAFT_936174 [Schizopora paradoxa]
MSSDDDHSSLVLQAYHYFPDLHGDVDRQALLAARRVMLRYGSGLVTFIMLCRYWNDTTTIKLVIVKKDSYLRYFGHQRLDHYLKLLLPTSYDRDEIKHMRLLACSDECGLLPRHPASLFRASVLRIPRQLSVSEDGCSRTFLLISRFYYPSVSADNAPPTTVFAMESATSLIFRAMRTRFDALPQLPEVNYYVGSYVDFDSRPTPLLVLRDTYPSNVQVLAALVEWASSLSIQVFHNLACVPDPSAFSAARGRVNLGSAPALFYITGQLVARNSSADVNANDVIIKPFAETWERAAAVLGCVLKSRSVLFRSDGHGLAFDLPELGEVSCYNATESNSDVTDIRSLPSISFTDISLGACVLPVFSVSYKTPSEDDLTRFDLDRSFKRYIRFRLHSLLLLGQKDEEQFVAHMFNIFHHALGVKFRV